MTTNRDQVVASVARLWPGCGGLVCRDHATVCWPLADEFVDNAIEHADAAVKIGSYLLADSSLREVLANDIEAMDDDILYAEGDDGSETAYVRLNAVLAVVRR